MIFATDIIEDILVREGTVFTDRPADRGGPTCCGITLDTYAAYRAPVATTVDDLKKVDTFMARQVYQHTFIEAPNFSKINDQPLRAVVVDAGVQHGVVEATKMLQRAAGIAPDGMFGAGSIAAVNAADPLTLRMLVCGARIRLYGLLVAHDPKLPMVRRQGINLQAENALGWANRIAQFVEEIT